METPTRVEVDGEVFVIAPRADTPGQFDYTWISGRDPNYGFSEMRSDRATPTMDEFRESIREFLAEIDPETGYMAD